MPVYVHCPHCEHPQIVGPHRRGRTHLCRQCGRAYRSSAELNIVSPLQIASLAELRGTSQSRQRVYVIE